MLLYEFTTAVVTEVDRAQSQYPPLHSHHEAYSVILEELDEYREEVWKRRTDRDTAVMRRELVQIAAMAARAAMDLT